MLLLSLLRTMPYYVVPIFACLFVCLFVSVISYSHANERTSCKHLNKIILYSPFHRICFVSFYFLTSSLHVVILLLIGFFSYFFSPFFSFRGMEINKRIIIIIKINAKSALIYRQLILTHIIRSISS